MTAAPASRVPAPGTVVRVIRDDVVLRARIADDKVTMIGGVRGLVSREVDDEGREAGWLFAALDTIEEGR